MRFGAVIFFTLITLVASGCATRIAPIPYTGTATSDAISVKAAEKLAQRNAQIVSLKALYRAEVSYGSTRDLFRYAVTLDRPERIRVEILPINMAYSLLVLTAGANSIRVVDFSNDRVVQGTDVRAIMRSELRLPLLPRELMALLLGGVPFELSDQRATWYRNPETQHGDALFLISPDRSFRMQIDPLTAQPIRTQIVDLEDERVLLEVIYTGFQSAEEGYGLPELMEVTVPEESIAMRLKLRSAAVNGIVKESVFEGVN